MESYLAENRSLKWLATQAGLDHSLLRSWVKRYHAGELTLDISREEALTEAVLKIAALERKVRKLTMGLELLKGGLITVPATSNARWSIISGPAGSPSGGGAA